MLLVLQIAIALTLAGAAGGDRTTVFALGGAAANPLKGGVIVGIERRLAYDAGDSILFRDLYFEYGAELAASALYRPAVHAEWLPLKILKLRLQYEAWFWPGFHLGSGNGLTFPSASSPFGPDELTRRKGEEVAAIGHHLLVLPTFQIKLWRIAAVDQFELGLWYIHGPESYWLDPFYDNLIKRGAPDAVLRNSAFLLFEAYRGDAEESVYVGPMYEVVHTISAAITRQRVGLAASATPFAHLGPFDRPTLLFATGLNLEDRNRQGEPWVEGLVRVDFDLAP
jgi:hypothetical protein